MKWVRALEALSALQPRLRKTKLVVVADREADIHELFARQASAPRAAQLLIRAERSRNRKTAEEDDSHNIELLWLLVTTVKTESQSEAVTSVEKVTDLLALKCCGEPCHAWLT